MGAICEFCRADMGEAATCVEVPVETLEGRIAPIRYGAEPEDWGAASGAACHDCLVHPGGFHHPGCDVERCPICGGQVIWCECAIVIGPASSTEEAGLHSRRRTAPDDFQWPSGLSPEKQVYVPKTITRGEEWIYSVMHEADGDWQFIDGLEHTTDEGERVPLRLIIHLDHTVTEVLDLAPGDCAYRDEPGGAWIRLPNSAR